MPRNSLFVVALALAACHADTHATSPAGGTPGPVAPAKPHAGVPDFFADIPADTPYLFASVDGIPPEISAGWFKRLGPAFREGFEQARRESAQPDPTMDAIAAELEGKWNAAGLESLGFAAQPRFAIYGFGALPIVMRLEISDGNKLMAALARISAKAGKPLDAQQTRQGKKYWRFPGKQMSSIVMISEREVVFAVGHTDSFDEYLDAILGITKPRHNLGDGQLIARLMHEHGFPGYGLGYIDTKLFLRAAVAEATDNDKPSEACLEEFERLAGRAPRVVFGYRELTPTRTTFTGVIELAPDLAHDLAALTVEIPGLRTAMASHPLFAFGGGLDLAAAQQLAVDTMTSWDHAAKICEPRGDDHEILEAISTLSERIPPPFDNLTGGLLALQQARFDTGSPLPQDAEALVVITAHDAKQLFDWAVKINPALGRKGITTDGQLHEIVPSGLPFPLFAGVREHEVVLAVGSEGRTLEQRMLATPASGKAPLLAVSYDFPRALELVTHMGTAQPMSDAVKAIFDGIGQLSGTVEVTPRGLAFSVTVESH